jgi:hypothetical protein
VSKAKWETQLIVVDFHKAAKDMLQRLQAWNQHVFSPEKLEFLNHFQEQVKDMEDLVELEVERTFGSDGTGERNLLKETKAIFAHITALRRVYENELRPPLRSSVVAQLQGLESKDMRHKKSVQFSQFATIIPFPAPERETELTRSDDNDDYHELFKDASSPRNQNILRNLQLPQPLAQVHSPIMLLNNIAANSSQSLVSPRNPNTPPQPLDLEQADAEIEGDNHYSQDVE